MEREGDGGREDGRGGGREGGAMINMTFAPAVA